jgi:RND family efflux transporter MFP subunit
MIHRSICVSLGCLLVMSGLVSAADEVVKVTVAPAKIEGATQQITLPASLEPLERTSIYGKVTGYLAERPVDIGSRVKAGQVIAKIAVPEMEQQVKLAEAKVVAAKAAVTKAAAYAAVKKVTHDRLAELYKVEKGAVAQLEVEVAAADYTAARAEAEAAKANVEVAVAEVNSLKAMLDYAVIHAPFDGVITQRQMDIGALITAGATTKPIFEVAQTNVLRLTFDVPERLLSSLSQGQKVKFGVEAMPGGSFSGALSRSAGQVDPRTRTMRAEVDVKNDDGKLAPGMYGTVKFGVADLKNTVVVPATAVRSSGGSAAVFVVDNGVAKKTPVMVLIDDGKETAVSGAVAVGAQVVTAGPADLADGARVEARVAEAAK